MAQQVNLVPLEDGSFRLTLGEQGGGRLKPLHLWPSTKLVTVCGLAAGLERYEDFPAQANPTALAFIMQPVLWLVWCEAEVFSAEAVRHLAVEGVGIAALRAGLRQHLPLLTATEARLAEVFLVEVQAAGAILRTEPDLMEVLVAELQQKGVQWALTAGRAYAESHYPKGSDAKAFISSVTAMADPALPPRLRKMQEALKRPREDAQPPAPAAAARPSVPADSFFCKSCGKTFPKSEGPKHRESAEHKRNKSTR